MRIFIYGVPGVGKTHYSKVLGKELGLSVFEADKIKKEERKGKHKKNHPFLYLGTCLAYQQFGDLNEVNVIKGLIAVRHALQKALEAKIKKHDHSIIEGAFLEPGSVRKFGKPLLLVTTDEEKHKRQFLSHREKLLDLQNNEFRSARIIQKFLINEAKQLDIEIIDNKKKFEAKET